MPVDRAERLSPFIAPWIETLLAQERVIAPQAAGMRARAFARAHALVAAGPATALPHTSIPRPSASGWYKVIFGSAAGVGLLSSVALVHLASSHSSSAPNLNQPLVTLQALAPSPSAVMETPPPAVLPPSPDLEKAEGATAAQVPSSDDQADEATAPSQDELGLLERAKKADARGDFSAVLAVAARHERLYPSGHLCEEREVLRLRALIGLGRAHDAQRTVRKFHHDFPHSVLLPALDQMLAASR